MKGRLMKAGFAISGVLIFILFLSLLLSANINLPVVGGVCVDEIGHPFPPCANPCRERDDTTCTCSILITGVQCTISGQPGICNEGECESCSCSWQPNAPTPSQACGINGCAPYEMSEISQCNAAWCSGQGSTRCMPSTVCDNQPPTTTISPDGKDWSNQDVTVTLTCNDAGSGCDKIYYTTTITRTCPASINSYTSQTPVNNQVTETVSCGDINGDGIDNDVCIKKACFFSTDKSGNQEPIKESNDFKIDKQKPVSTLNPLSTNGWVNLNTIFIISCSDGGGSGCATVANPFPKYRIVDPGNACSGSFTQQGSGSISCSDGQICNKEICYYSTDIAGNNELERRSGSFDIDKTIPVTNFFKFPASPAGWNSWYLRVVGITLSCSDTGSLCKETLYCSDNSGTCTPSIKCETAGVLDPYCNLQLSTNGVNYFRFYSRDNAFNSETLRSETIRIDRVNPTFNGFSFNTALCDDQDPIKLANKECFIRSQKTIDFTASHSDSESLPFRQVISFSNDGCAPDSAGCTEIRSNYTVASSLFSEEVGKQDNTRINIIDGVCTDPDASCTDTTSTVKWTATIMALQEDYKIWTKLSDNSGRGGFIDTGWKIIVRPTGPLVSVTGWPTSWTNQDVQANVLCTPPSGSTCDSTTAKLKVNYLTSVPSLPPACDANYANYPDSAPKAINNYAWVCGTEKTNGDVAGFSSPTEFKIDKDTPFSITLGIDPIFEVAPGYKWTNQSFFNVSWSGFDGPSGIDTYQLQYRVEKSGSLIQSWTDWHSSGTRDTSQYFSELSPTNLPGGKVLDNHTYSFRIKATDEAGNQDKYDKSLPDYKRNERISFPSFSDGADMTANTLLLHLDEPTGATVFEDTSGENVEGRCGPPGCLTQVEGIYTSAQAIQNKVIDLWDATRHYYVQPGERRTIHFWFKANDKRPGKVNYLMRTLLPVQSTTLVYYFCEDISDSQVACGSSLQDHLRVVPTGTTGASSEFGQECRGWELRIDNRNPVGGNYPLEILQYEDQNPDGYPDINKKYPSLPPFCTTISRDYLVRDSSMDYYDNEWHNVVIVIDRPGGVMKMFVDGRPATIPTVEIGNSGDSSGAGLSIGSPAVDKGYGSFTMDEVAIWERALSDDEILDLYNRISKLTVHVDIKAPECTINPLPAYTKNVNIPLTLNVFEQGSGLKSTQINVVPEGSCAKPTFITPAGGDFDSPLVPPALNLLLSGAEGCTYTFRCNATDNVGNTGGYSPAVTTTIDSLLPSARVNELPPWMNSTRFNVSWDKDSSPETSGINCYEIEYQFANESPFSVTPIPPWDTWETEIGVLCTSKTSAFFGPFDPVSVTNGLTYYFEAAAKDNAGNEEVFNDIAETKTTIDIDPPSATIVAYDQASSQIAPPNYIISAQPLSSVRIVLSSEDLISGIQSNIIKVYKTDNSGSRLIETQCPSADPYGGNSVCEVTYPIDTDTTIKFWGEAMDRAGNAVTTKPVFITAHPLANFINNNINMTVGESRLTKIQVRNLREQTDKITVSLDNYQYATFIESEEQPGKVDINPDKRTATITLGPDEDLELSVQILSSEPGQYQLSLEAHTADNTIPDNDSVDITITFSASFSEINEWAIGLLILVALVVFYRVNNRKNN